MKRKSFCAFGLAFWLIAFSTLFSFAVERWMTPIVEVVDSMMSGQIPLDSLQWEEDGPHLYSVSEGDNWLSGTRAGDVAPDQYSVDENAVYPSYSAGNIFVHYTSKPILDGGLVNKEYRAGGPGPDVRLIFPLDGSAPRLQHVESTLRPFMEGRLKKELEAEKIYSLYETRDFFSALTLLAVVPAGVIFCIILWIVICFLSKDARKNRNKLFLNAGVMLVFLAFLPIYLSKISLPSSLLPRANLLEATHYRAEFSDIFPALEHLAKLGDSTAQELLRHVSATLWTAGGVVLAGLLLGGCVALLELRIGRRTGHRTGQSGKRKHTPRHAAPRQVSTIRPRR